MLSWQFFLQCWKNTLNNIVGTANFQSSCKGWFLWGRVVQGRSCPLTKFERFFRRQTLIFLLKFVIVHSCKWSRENFKDYWIGRRTQNSWYSEFSVYFQDQKCQAISEWSLSTFKIFFSLWLKNSMKEILKQNPCIPHEEVCVRKEASSKPREIRRWFWLWVFIIPRLCAIFKEKNLIDTVTSVPSRE